MLNKKLKMGAYTTKQQLDELKYKLMIEYLKNELEVIPLFLSYKQDTSEIKK